MVAPAWEAACAIAHESERLFATPTTRPTLPERSDMVTGVSASCLRGASLSRHSVRDYARRAGAVRGSVPVRDPDPALVLVRDRGHRARTASARRSPAPVADGRRDDGRRAAGLVRCWAVES